MSLLQMSFSGGVMILVIAAIRALTHQRLPKAVFPALWAVAVLRLLLPFSVPSPTSVYSLAADPPPAQMAQTVLPQAWMSQLPPRTQPASPQAVLTETPAGIDLWVVVWSIGFGACLLYFAIGYFRGRREFQTALPVEHETIRSILEIRPLRRTVSVRQSDRVAVPMTYGLLRPVILLPPGLAQAGEDTLAYVLIHELTHIRRFDGTFKLLLVLTFCIHWFNPAVWLLFALCSRDIELSCDEAVLTQMHGDARSNYAKVLIALESEKSGLSPLYNSFSKTAIEARIKAIMKYKKATAAGLLCALALVIGVTAVFATSPREQQAQTQTKITQLGILGRFEPTQEYLLKEYGPYGISFGEDGTMLYNGEPVHYFWDGYELYTGAESIRATRYEYANPDTTRYYDAIIDLRVVREKIKNDDGSINYMGPIKELSRYVEENFDLYAGLEGPQQTTAEGGDGTGGVSFEEKFKQYAAFGITYEPQPEGSGRGNVYFNGELVGMFVDISYRPRGVFSYGSIDSSPLTAYTVRDKFDNIVEVRIGEALTVQDVQDAAGNVQAHNQLAYSLELFRPYGLITEFLSKDTEAPVRFRMTYHGKQVRSFDTQGYRTFGEFGSDLSAYGEDAIDLYAVYDGDTILKLEEPTGEMREEWDAWLQRCGEQN